MRVFVYEHLTALGASEPNSLAPSLLAEGQAMLDAILADFHAVPNVTILTAHSPAEFSTLATEANYTLVIAPECGGLLESLCRTALACGTTLLGPTPEAIRLTTDKFALGKHWEKCGVPTPTCWRLGEQPADGLFVIKPRDGAGSQATRLSNLPVAEPWEGELIAQTYVDGLAVSVSFLLSPTQTLPLWPTQQILSTDGRFHYLGSQFSLTEAQRARAVAIAQQAIACVPGLAGYVGVDLVLGADGQDWAIEINPRLTTSYVLLRERCTSNLAGAMLEMAQGKMVAKLEWKSA